MYSESGVLQKTTVIYHSLMLQLDTSAIHQLYAAMLPASLGQSSSQIVKKTIYCRKCCIQMSPHFNLSPGKMAFEFSVPKTKGTIQTFIATEAKASFGRRTSTSNAAKAELLKSSRTQPLFIAHFINLYLLFSFFNTYIYVYSLVFVLYIIALSMEQT